MPALNSKIQLCNLANGSQGLRNSINDIDKPRSDKEVVYSQWYDITRQYLLKLMMPNFALNRIIVSAKEVPAGYVDQYAYAYEYPVRCLKLLGIGAIDCITNPPTVENNLIFTNSVYTTGLPIRFIDDVTDVTVFSPDFIFVFQAVLGKVTAMANTQDPAKKASLLKDTALEVMNSTAQNAQENKPIRRSISRFRLARMGCQDPYDGTGSANGKN